MWIRSQNGKYLIDVNNVEVDGKDVTTDTQGNCTATLGSYANEERAMEVLNNIQRKIMNGVQFDKIDNFGERVTRLYVFQMPKR